MATQNTYLYIGGDLATSTGGTKVKNNTSKILGWIEVSDFSFSVGHVGSQPPGMPRSVENVVRTPMTIKKKVDARSPKLFRACCRAAIYDEASLLVFGSNRSAAYITYQMRGIHISKYETSLSNQIPEETLELTFDQMKIIFDNAGLGTLEQGNIDSSGAQITGTVEETWNWIMEIPGFTWMPTGNI